MNRTPDRKKEHQQESNPPPRQLCWSCRRTHDGPGGCPWFAKEPRAVEGWDAVPCVVKECHGQRVKTYAIRHCPDYLHDPRVDAERLRENIAYYKARE